MSEYDLRHLLEVGVQCLVYRLGRLAGTPRCKPGNVAKENRELLFLTGPEDLFRSQDFVKDLRGQVVLETPRMNVRSCSCMTYLYRLTIPMETTIPSGRRTMFKSRF